ncbi:MAG TPA: DUF6786 family protein [Bacteroidales bacterium]
MKTILVFLIAAIMLSSCGNTNNTRNYNNQKERAMAIDSTKQYGFNRDFLKKHTTVIELKNSRSAISIVPAWQARVMTSTAAGDSGYSFGWINRDHIVSGKLLPHINAFGGEERIWLGPEGGQFSIFFSKGKPFTYENWQTPAFLDTTPFQQIASSDSSALFANDISTQNYSGTSFSLRIEREITLLTGIEISGLISADVKTLKYVAYRSVNKIINKGENKWEKETGLLSIWMLGMFNPSPAIIIVIPVKPGEEKLIGPMVNDTYFGKIASDRLKVSGNHIFFKADGISRGKIGIPPLRANGIMGSYDSENKILTLLICRLAEGKKDYVNSAWQIQENPFSGDALNSYNDGPLADGSQMGPFYELETSSAAADLKPGESLSHVQFTIHLTGDLQELDKVSRKVLGVSLEEISKAF